MRSTAALRERAICVRCRRQDCSPLWCLNPVADQRTKRSTWLTVSGIHCRGRASYFGGSHEQDVESVGCRGERAASRSWRRFRPVR